MSIQLLGLKGEIDNIGKLAKNQANINVRTFVIYQQLTVLQHCHELYHDDPKLNMNDFFKMKE